VCIYMRVREVQCRAAVHHPALCAGSRFTALARAFAQLCFAGIAPTPPPAHPLPHPVANTQDSRLSGKGFLMELPRTKCFSVTRISCWRPGSAIFSSTSLPLAPPSIARSCSMMSFSDAPVTVARPRDLSVREGGADLEAEAPRRRADARGATEEVTTRWERERAEFIGCVVVPRRRRRVGFRKTRQACVRGDPDGVAHFTAGPGHMIGSAFPAVPDTRGAPPPFFPAFGSYPQFSNCYCFTLFKSSGIGGSDPTKQVRRDGVLAATGGDAIMGGARRTVARVKWERGDREGRGATNLGVRVGAPPAELCPPARTSPRLSPTHNLSITSGCGAASGQVGEELGERLLEEWDDPVLKP